MYLKNVDSVKRMRCTVIFLVLSLVVLMAEPGEGFLHLIGHLVHGIFSGRVVKVADEQEQLDKRGIDYNPGPKFNRFNQFN
ncbi:pleurocidin-like peptide WF3 [Sphaeramia orbicularis]|uniref:pleurocidin-like peptide WF3 n=1 Tax=Sphaeramia orbicularis TaxID=375764 RepID=UPI00117DF8DD|nr:pleurocidin-like peptide WF3 [Sphaeramia orbicularis]